MFPTSIKTKMVLALLLPTLVIGGILLLYVVIDSRQLLSSFNDRKMTDQLDAYATVVDSHISTVELAAQAIKRYSETTFMAYYFEASDYEKQNALDQYHQFLLNLSSSHKESTYFVYFMPQDNSLPESFGYGDYNQDGYTDPMPVLSRSYFTQDSLDADKQWFFNAVNTGKPAWFGPYEKFKGVPNGTTMTYSIPIYRNDTLIAVAGVDLPLATITQDLSTMTYYEKGYMALTDSQLKFISHPTLKAGQTLTDQLGSDYQSIEDALRLSESGQFLYKWFDRKDKVLSFITLHNGWRLVLTAYQDEIFYQNKSMNQSFGLLYLFSILGIGLFSILIGSWISHPVILLSRVIEHSAPGTAPALGKLETRKDEIGLLSRLLKQRLELSEQNLTALNHYNENLGAMVLKRSEDLQNANDILANKRALIQKHQQTLKQQNEELESSIQSMVATQHQMIEQEKNASFSQIISMVAEEIKPHLNAIFLLIEKLNNKTLTLDTYLSQGDVPSIERLDLCKSAQKNNRQVLGHLIYSKDIIDYIKDLTSTQNIKLVAAIELGDYLEKAQQLIRNMPLEHPITLTRPEDSLVYLNIDSGKFLHILGSLLIHLASGHTGNRVTEINFTYERLDNNLWLHIKGVSTSSLEQAEPQETDASISKTSHLGLAMIELLMKEAFGGAIRYHATETGREAFYDLYFPKVIVDASAES